MHIIALVFVAVSLAAIMALVSDVETYKNFEHAADLPEGKSCTVIGTLDLEKEMHFDPEQDANAFTFFMKDGDGESMQVLYRGAKPLDFERSEELTIKGKVEGNQFVADKLLMKCPSKYVEDEIIEASNLESSINGR